jgi:Acetyltransferases
MTGESATNIGPITLRPIETDDEPFLLSVYASTRAAEMAQVPWSEEQRAAFVQMQFTAQKQHYETNAPEAKHDVILFNGMPVGRIYVDRSEKVIHVLDITVLPEHRHQGIGLSLIKSLMEEAASSGKAVTIHVETYNPSRQIFERLGFLPLEDDGMNILFEWRAAR